MLKSKMLVVINHSQQAKAINNFSKLTKSGNFGWKVSGYSEVSAISSPQPPEGRGEKDPQGTGARIRLTLQTGKGLEFLFSQPENFQNEHKYLRHTVSPIQTQ